MPKNKQQKKEIVDQLTDKLSKSKSAVFVDYKGLKVKEVEELRRECKKQNSEYLVAKKTLIKLAVDKSKIEGVNIKEMEGNLALVLGYEDEVSPAKTVKDFSKKYDALKMLSGVMEGKFIDKQMVKNLADIPSKPELYAKLVGSINAPVSGFVNVLRGNLRNLIYALNAIKESKI
jgi:large subunit ribosomal protein L10